MDAFVDEHGQTIDVIRHRLETFTTAELEESLILNRRVTPPPDGPPEVRLDPELRQKLALEMLNARRGVVPVKWLVCATAEDHAAGMLERGWRSLPWNYRRLTGNEVWAIKALK